MAIISKLLILQDLWLEKTFRRNKLELKERYEDILLLGKELSLHLLELFQKENKKAIDYNDLDKSKTILNELIPKFEKLFFEFSLEVPEEFEEDEVEKVEELVYKILEEYDLDEELLWEKVRLRLSLGENSGSFVVKKLFEIQLKDLEKSLNSFLSIEKEYFEKEKKLEKALADCIQADEELEAFEKLREHGKKIDELDEKIVKLEEKINELRYNLESRWPYEIYGTISKEKLYEEVKNEKHSS